MPLTNIRRVKHNQVTSQLSVDALNMGHPCKLLSSIFTPSLLGRRIPVRELEDTARIDRPD
jgi:hypothetical protein